MRSFIGHCPGMSFHYITDPLSCPLCRRLTERIKLVDMIIPFWAFRTYKLLPKPRQVLFLVFAGVRAQGVLPVGPE